MSSKVEKVGSVLRSTDAKNRAWEHARLADALLIHSGELLKLVVRLGSTVNSAANSLNFIVNSARVIENENATSGHSCDVEMHSIKFDSAKSVTGLAIQAALSIRRIIGWNQHPYLLEQRNGANTLIGIEGALAELSKQTVLGAASIGDQGDDYSAVYQRILIMVGAAERNTMIAKANAAAVEVVEAMAIKIIHTIQAR